MAVVETARRLKDVLLRRPKRLTMEEYAAKLIRKGLDPHGQVVANPVPIAPPIGWKKQPSMVEIVREMVRGEKLRLEALEAGHESFEESEDFDVGDEPELLRSAWENEFDPDLRELVAAGKAEIDKRAQSSEVPPSLKPGTPPEGAQSPAPGPEAPDA